ncbi:MAG: glycosyltransferase [Hyphomicrobiales bacterium]|nr:glycosyltransferase [Hyphomicrobiales bacterium]
MPGLNRRTCPELSLVVPTFNERQNLAELIARVDRALAGIDWEMIVVDDDSPDQTAKIARDIGRSDARIRCLRRVGRRGLSGACIEGMMASSAPFIAVMDADLQHDEQILPLMLAQARAGADLVIGSRHVEGGSSGSGFSARRDQMSQLATRFAGRLLHTEVTDLMSGFFLLKREIAEQAAPSLTPSGFKILVDLIAAAPAPLKIVEVGYVFRARMAGQSKFDLKIALEFVGLLAHRASGGRIPVRFVFFALTGASGVIIYLLTLKLAMLAGAGFSVSQALAILVSMTSNFFVNNAFTYADAKLRNIGPLLRGLLFFYVVCAFGSIVNLGIGDWLYDRHQLWWIAGLAGLIMGSVWNYTLSSIFVWRHD